MLLGPPDWVAIGVEAPEPIGVDVPEAMLWAAEAKMLDTITSVSHSIDLFA